MTKMLGGKLGLMHHGLLASHSGGVAILLLSCHMPQKLELSAAIDEPPSSLHVIPSLTLREWLSAMSYHLFDVSVSIPWAKKSY